MQPRIICNVIAFSLCSLLPTQQTQVQAQVHSQAQVQSQRPKGYPSREGSIDIRQHFANPPKGYGNAPFYWWNGDSLNRERLSDQLELLRDASTDGLAVSYIHSHPAVDVKLNANGFGAFGRADPGSPGIFTDEWWKTWNWFSGECADAGIGLGLDDYVVGWAKNGYYVDELLRDKAFANYQGRLTFKKHPVQPGAKLELSFAKPPLSVIAYPGGMDLTKAISNNRLTWHSTATEPLQVYVVSTEAAYELHPDYGQRLLDVYFNRFEQHLDARGRKGMNYFFQDELHYPLTMRSWSEDFPAEFKKRKGYDILPYLPALIDPIGDITPKVRLDYADVLTALSEERYFKPIFDWHQQRGLIYGCDNSGRGLEPLEYVDYFRVTSWFTAPGNDAPARGSSFRQTKVSSSVTHLYQRQRTWLEAFHSMGWDSNGEWLTSQLDHHLIAGGNLLCMHGLYYSTHGGWWEWAPPCFHFRMPYWPHMKLWLKYAERMCFLLSQGTHACDVAVMYPTESMQAYPGTQPRSMWSLVDSLSLKGLDYDFIDYHSLQQATISDRELSIAGEQYKVLILADIKAMHRETLLKVRDFYRNGGIVLATGEQLKATSGKGENDPELHAILHELFGSSSSNDASSNSGKGIYQPDYRKIPALISSLIRPDFSTSTGTGRVLHRKIGKQDVYMVMNIERDAEMFFRATGKVECWNAKDGSIHPQPILRQTEEGTWIRFDGTHNVSRMLVFSPGTPLLESTSTEQWEAAVEQPITGDWGVELIPTMNNKWGDFRLPATDELIGAEAREFTYQFVPAASRKTNVSSQLPAFVDNAPKGVYGYAPLMETITLPTTVDLQQYLTAHLSASTVTTASTASTTDQSAIASWKPYCFSWQYGVFDNPGGQGYHGLKGKVDNRFLILDQGGHQLFRCQVYAPQAGRYKIEQEGVTPDYLFVDGQRITAPLLDLQPGWHRLLLAYAHTPKGSYVLSEKTSYSVDERQRSAVVLYPEIHPVLKDNDPYGSIIATKWYATSHLPYSIEGARPGTWHYRFATAPGTRTMDFRLKGSVTALWVDGRKVKSNEWKALGEGVYRLTLNKPQAGISLVTLAATPETGYDGPAFFLEPVRLTCGQGRMPAGNWADCGALKFFSGGIRYTKSVEMIPPVAPKVTLDLGVVDATCEVTVNGQPVEVLMNSPYQTDISRFVKPGKNEIEVLVYSTLSNHYQTIPSAYRGAARAGLIGPVKLRTAQSKRVQ